MLGLTACSQDDGDRQVASQEQPTTVQSSSVISSANPAESDRSTPSSSVEPNPTVGANGATGGASENNGQDNAGQEQQCSGLTGEQAASRWIGEVAQSTPGWEWTTEHANTFSYDDCAPLSAIAVTVRGGTASSPYHIMLFHHGRYLGTATKDAYGFAPSVDRLSDSVVAVTYHWRRPGETTAEHSGETYAEFAWDFDAGKVVMTGDVPPTG
ncbi:LppP/LprE family lipoprotein [Corynebacterium tapiri]|uniref:LppP/LprE family lipoprotein n=2 Tax=Corynebacterium tapiri TaxID=1448266 RepID=A0A5C4U5F8_9CORY|nr:LppP/LprE family lipoprotein [Corynebacterium tapiri]